MSGQRLETSNLVRVKGIRWQTSSGSLGDQMTDIVRVKTLSGYRDEMADHVRVNRYDRPCLVKGMI